MSAHTVARAERLTMVRLPEASFMPSKRATYIPITSIVITIVVLVAVVGVISYRDIDRGRRYVADILRQQSVGLLITAGADVRAELGSPTWERRRIDAFFEEVVAAREGVAYLALLDESATVLVHSDAEKVGTTWEELPDVAPEPAAPSFDRAFGPGMGMPWFRSERAVSERIVSVDGRRVYEYATAIDLPVPGEAAEWIRRMDRRHFGRGMRGSALDEEAIRERLADLLGRPLDESGQYRLVAVVGLDPAELEAGFHASRNYTILLAAVLLLVGGVAIYFLYTAAHHRSTRTALENMRSYTRNVIESMASGLVSADADGRVATVNPGARSLLGLGEADAEGRRLRDVVRLSPPAEYEGIERVLSGEQTKYETEAKIVVGETETPVALAASLLRDEEGNRSGAVLLMQDLSEIETLKEAVERERHLASLGRIAAGVAHEVRNPLSSLKGFAQFLRGKSRPGSEEERYSDIMIEEVERLDRVVQELLDFARPVSPARTVCDANDLIEQSLRLVAEDAQFKKIKIERRLAADLPHVFVDAQQIRQAILNLLINGIEAMEEGGTLTIETSVSRQVQGSPVVGIDIGDTGTGMTADEIGKLFEPFYTTKPKGTGLGLTFVSRLLEQNGGSVMVTSVKGQGSTFSVRLPIAAHERVAMSDSGDNTDSSGGAGQDDEGTGDDADSEDGRARRGDETTTDDGGDAGGG